MSCSRIFTLLLVALAAVPAAAQADGKNRPRPIVAPPSAISLGFFPSSVTISQGGALDFYNLDLAVHDLTIDARDRRGYEIFRSGQVTVSNTLAEGPARVQDVPKLKPGRYTFFCSLHSQMRGELVIEPNEPLGGELPSVPPPSPPEPEPPAAGPPEQRVVAGPGAVTTSYANSEVVIFQGDGLLLSNFDMVMHSVTSQAYDKAGQALFDSAAPGFNGTERVDGVERLAPGEYRFQCFFHSTLRGRLTVLPRPAGLAKNHSGRNTR